MVGPEAKSSSLDEVNHSGKSIPKGGCGSDRGIESLSGSKAEEHSVETTLGWENIGRKALESSTLFKK